MRQSIVSLFQIAFDEVGRDETETYAELQSRVQDKVKGKDLIIPAGKIVQINCKNKCKFNRETESNDSQEWKELLNYQKEFLALIV